ncbi:uncharacterized protein HKW66_Vig0106100 [Vigna angularis]|uniref:Uncharacterized protein n=1 Tax=Phaseolus angularis TaxID=3914 RepID=A0A8T0KI08_PHAAN|nr:uncharacterized protein HKW66_Vig0106100 [Vigna angularis]
MAGLPARLRIQPADVKAAAMWGVAAATGGLYLVQFLASEFALMSRICALCLVRLLAFGEFTY